jgi:XTP/dITP diphosphohydrolase
VIRLLAATRNAHKTREIRQILGLKFEVRDLSEDLEVPETVESGTSFKENAVLKAVTASRYLPGFIIADDSGLEVYALDGAPGIHSARYAGQTATDGQNIEKLLGELSRIGSKDDGYRARYRCVVALGRDGRILGTFEGNLEGKIIARPRGSQGFGYDPIFVPNGFGETLGELPAEVKNKISHRAQAIHAVADKLATAWPSD